MIFGNCVICCRGFYDKICNGKRLKSSLLLHMVWVVLIFGKIFFFPNDFSEEITFIFLLFSAYGITNLISSLHSCTPNIPPLRA